LNASSWILKVSQIENHIYFINPFIPEVFQRVLILFNLTIAIAMGIEFAKLYSGVQTKRLALLTIGLKLFSLCISLYIVAGSGIWNPDFPIHMVQVFGEDIGVSPIFQKFWNNFPTFLVVVMIFGYVIETIQTVWRTWNVRFPEK
jgi:hypothetical protein